jgi:hypothetical protein
VSKRGIVLVTAIAVAVGILALQFMRGQEPDQGSGTSRGVAGV